MKKKILYVTICLLSLLTTVKITASTFPNNRNDQPQVIPPSPQSMVFENYLNHEIVEYNGLPDISIPLYEIEIKGLKIPIALSYHAGGVKYKQYDGDVGANWSINAGGYRISRTIYGKNDENNTTNNIKDYITEAEYRSYQLSSYQNDNNKHVWEMFLACIGGLSIPFHPNNQIIPADKFSADCARDLFSYILPSSNGKFIIDNPWTKSIAILDKKMDKIIIDEGNARIKLDDFKIIDNSGFTYYMGTKPDNNLVCEVPKDISPAAQPKSVYRTAWPLKRIVSPYNQMIDFTYNAYNATIPGSNYTEVEEAKFEGMIIMTEHVMGEPYLHEQILSHAQAKGVFSNRLYTEMLFIEEIKSDNLTVKFNRKKTGNSPYLLNDIQVYNNQNILVKSVYFEYDQSGSHTLLTKIRIGKGSNNEKQYSFEYYAPPTNRFPDQWGYYKGSSTYIGSTGNVFLDRVIINKDILITSTSVNRYTSINLGSILCTTSDLNFLQGVNWQDRSTNTQVPNAFSLKKITFPTGGTTEYTYEPHQYKKHQRDSLLVKGGGQRIKKIISKSDPTSIPIITEFFYGNGKANFDVFPEHFANLYWMYMPCHILDRKVTSIYRVKTYSEKPLSYDIDNFQVSYESVETRRSEEGGRYNGRTVSYYNIKNPYIVEPVLHDTYFYTLTPFDGVFRNGLYSEYVYRNAFSRYYNHLSNYSPGYKPLLVAREFRDDRNSPIKKERYEYVTTPEQTFWNVNISQKIFFQMQSYPLPGHGYAATTGELVSSLYDCAEYYFTKGTDLLVSKTTSMWKDEYNSSTTITEQYEYDDKLQIKNIKTLNSDQKEHVTKMNYPYNFAGSVYTSMVTQNIITPVIEEIYTVGNKEVNRIKTNYSQQTWGGFLPSNIQHSSGGEQNLSNQILFNRYDINGNILQYWSYEDIYTTYLWSYKRAYPIAEIKNATYDQVKSIIAESTLDAIAAKSEPTAADMITINNLRQSLPDALITTYTYKPLVGITSMTDPRGVVTYYEYDTFGRLMRTKDNEGKTLQEYDYHYRNQ